MLSEDKRLQLDGIVSQMVKNKESDDVIQFVVDDFKSKYDTNIAKSPLVDSTFSQSSDNSLNIGQKAKDLVIGAGKGVANSVLNIAKFGEKGIQAILPGIKVGETGADKIKATGVATPSNQTQKLGFMGEQIAEFFIPGGLSLKAGKSASNLVKGSNLAKNVAKLSATGLSEGALSAGQTAIQEGEFNKNVKEAGIAGAIMPAAFSGLGKITKTAGKYGAELLGKSTGTSGETILQAFKNPNVIKFAREAGQDIDKFQDNVLNETKSALRLLADKRASSYQKQLSKIKLNKSELDNILFDTRDKAVNLIDNYDIGFVVDETGKKLNKLDFSKSTLVEGQNVVEKALNDVLGWTDNSAAGLDKLKRRLGSYADQLSSREKRQAMSFVLDLKESINNGLKKNVKGYESMTKGYSEASDLIDDINKTFSIGNNKARETQLKKVLGSLRDNNENRKELLDVLSKTGNKDLVGKVAGAQLAKLTPRGLAGAIAPTAGGLAAAVNPSNIPMVMAYFLSSSPRVVGELTSILGKVDKQMIKSNKFSPQIQRAIRELMLKNTNSKDDTKNLQLK